MNTLHTNSTRKPFEKSWEEIGYVKISVSVKDVKMLDCFYHKMNDRWLMAGDNAVWSSGEKWWMVTTLGGMRFLPSQDESGMETIEVYRIKDLMQD